ncbi:MAG: homocysteine S-methyltransferase, partial [Duodenibacillus sp.]|nr:homocysteine S-methyltransferase [Duodenibacillus sp.]
MRIAINEFLRDGPFVIDGSMSTALEILGAAFTGSKLWTARTLVDNPGVVKEVHKAYFRAGADCGITCSYQATIPGLTAEGLTPAESEAVIRNSVEVFLQARDEWWREGGEAAGRRYPLCLAACGPYGAYLADGSEYRGRYGVSDAVLREFHLRRAEILWEAGADLLLFETAPSLPEALIEAEIAEELGADYWISFCCRDGETTHEGQRLEDAARVLSQGHPRLRMLGVNCTPPQFMPDCIASLKAGSDLPVAVYPNSGEVYDGLAGGTKRQMRDGLAALANDLHASANAMSLVGGMQLARAVKDQAAGAGGAAKVAEID